MKLFGSLKYKVSASILLGFALLGVGFTVMPSKASAEYVDGNLIEDALFLDAASMSQQQIQDFLTGRAGYLASYVSWSARDNANVGAARIIYEAAQDYGISPKVILATLQKEQSLVTAKNPTNSQLNFAMGYGCPDSTGCSANYIGFYSQIDNATWQFRYNFERARGNNTWWRNSSSYPCSGATRYYSTGLYAGRYVTFMDDAGTGYKAFTLAGAATASLYCYTPHAYPGSAAQYYSGSYNFVGAYEQWFGSTHAAVMVTHGLAVSQDELGVTHTDVGVKVTFTVTNGTDNTVDLGSMSVAGYDSAGNNVGYPLQRVVMAPHTNFTYSASQVFGREDTYTFWITDYVGGVWRDDYPLSSGIIVPRNDTQFIQAMPQITVQPTLSGEQRTGKTGVATFTVHNRSARTANLGKMGLAVYGPHGENDGMPLRTVTIPAGQDYVYSASQQWQTEGTYTAWVTDTKNDGQTYDDTFFPLTASTSIQRRVDFTVKPNPTVTQMPTLDVASPRAGQQINASFIVHNFSDNAVNGGKIGLAIYDPAGHNVGLPMRDLSISPQGDFLYNLPTTFYTPGRYTGWITYTPDGGRTYDDTTYPRNESNTIQRSFEFTVKSSPTITVAPALSVASPRAGQQINASFTMHNFGSEAVTTGKIGMAIYGPNGENVGLAMQSMALSPGTNQVYNLPTTFYTPGRYTGWITYTPDGRIYNDSTFPAVESTAIQRAFEFTVLPSPTITVAPALSVASPHVNQQVTAGFTLHNYGTEAVNSGKIGLAIYGPNGENVGLAMQSMTLTPSGDLVYQKTASFSTPGTYTAWVTYTHDDRIYNDGIFPASESTGIARRITFTVIP